MLLGIRSGTSVLRHEDAQRLPSLGAVLAYAVLFRLDPRSLFAGHFEDVEALVRARARKMLAQMDAASLGASPGADASRKRRALTEIIQSPDLHYVPWPED